uniref:Uncharacterized protein n=1 Tax=viral metagenome TaxID=1070528 RepID=A0A6M3LXJ6_9ZZZZ
MGDYFNLDKLDMTEITRIVQHDGVPEATQDEVEQFIDADWANADEHQNWLDTANAQEIGDWVASVLLNTHPSMVDLSQ